MAKKLTDNVVVSHPETGAVTVLFAGDKLPGWAKNMVGDHALIGDHEAVTTPDESGADKKGRDPEEPVGEEGEVTPYSEWTKQELQDECESRGLAKSGTKDELIARLEEDDAEEE